jgi:hypothetical protein
MLCYIQHYQVIDHMNISYWAGCNFECRASKKVEVYNMRTNKWSSLPDLNFEPSAQTAACSVDPRTNRICIFGGGTHGCDGFQAYNRVDY